MFLIASLIPTRVFDFGKLYSVYTMMMVSVNRRRMRSSSWGCPGGGGIILASDWTCGTDTIASGSHLRALPAAFTWNAFLSHQFCLLFARFVTAALLQIYNRKCCFNFDSTNITAQINSLRYFHWLHCLPCIHSGIFAYIIHILLYGYYIPYKSILGWFYEVSYRWWDGWNGCDRSYPLDCYIY